MHTSAEKPGPIALAGLVFEEAIRVLVDFYTFTFRPYAARSRLPGFDTTIIAITRRFRETLTFRLALEHFASSRWPVQSSIQLFHSLIFIS